MSTFVWFFVDVQNILDNEWDTIDNAVHRMDISAKLVDEINDHIYLKFSRRRFTCQANGTISLPVSAVL